MKKDMKKDTRTARLVVVENCSGCPFSYECDDEWTCTATEDKHGLYKTITRVQKRPRGPWLPPPKWCPLRKEIVVVAIGEKVRT
jgi:hypothetical protein